MKAWLPVLLVLTACPRVESDASALGRTRDGGAALPHAHIDLEAADGRAYGLEVELALTDATREHGLMFRTSLADGAGMLFVFAEPERHVFWMKNTLIPLDMVFADATGLVLGCVRRAEPMTETPRTIAGDSKYVLEVPGGFCAEHRIDRGARLVLGEAAKFRPE